MPYTPTSRAERGFSLIEMMVATAIMSLALALAGNFFVASRNGLLDELAREETLQGLRATLDTLERDLRLGGACLPTTGNDFPPLAGTNHGTLDGVTTRTALVRSDLTCIQSTVAATSPATGTTAGATTIPVQSVNGFAVGQRAYVRGSTNSGEYFNIAGVNTATNQLQIAAGLQSAYLNGSGVWAVDERAYAIDSTTYAPVTVLTIAANGTAPVPFAYGIQTVNVQYELASDCPPCDVVDLPSTTQWPLVNQLYLTVTMQSLKPLSYGQYFTATDTIGVKPRNLLPGTSVLGTPPA
ncbi:MAG TPA: prepilin-type N-terminal cleavage/methylation domain-containing protein [Verrucomicrobiae bacterium]|nr:prepilin-type N-terminal cleavage/methylation domain-containing protein [Verrucomicrobiae bacterium]